jgi:tRNA(fMet)-specific endonuclease VapC
MPAPIKRIGARDCQIAAIAISLGFTVITRNTRDFQRIPDVKFEDWTALTIQFVESDD